VGSVGAALALARQELGPEAVLLETRKAPPEAAHLGEYEVVFGTAGSNGTARSSPEDQTEKSKLELERLRSEVSQLRCQLERINTAFARTNLLGASLGGVEEAAACALSRLLEIEVQPELALEVVEAARRQKAAGAVLSWEEALAEELKRRCQVEGRLGKRQGGARVVARVGPGGSGKTTMLVKLAIREGLEKRQTIELLSLDNYRVGGAEQLRHFATILGVPFQALETPLGLAAALEESRRKDLVLIDTPGYGPAEEQEAEEMAQFLAAQPELECHLVLTASMRSADLWRVAERFERFRPAKLVFTRLDETQSYGALWSLAVRSGKPIAFLGTGQRIPEDVAPATAEGLLELLWRSPVVRAAAADA